MHFQTRLSLEVTNKKIASDKIILNFYSKWNISQPLTALLKKMKMM